MSKDPAVEPEHLRRARRLFIANVVLFIVLLLVAFFLLAGGSEEGEEAVSETVVARSTPPTLPELAYLKGQMAALREHPATLPEFEEEWVRKFCRRMVLRDASITETPEYSIESLVEAYYQGYKERFEDYFDASIAREFGYENGLKYDPLVHPLFSLRGIGAMLAPHEQTLRNRFQLDRPCWELFVQAFYEGIMDGYPVTQEGTTARPGKRIRWDFE